MKLQRKQGDGTKYVPARQKHALMWRVVPLLPRKLLEKIANNQIAQTRKKLNSLFKVDIKDGRLSHDLAQHFEIAEFALGPAKKCIKTNPREAFKMVQKAQAEICFVDEVVRRYQQGISTYKRPLAFANFVKSVRQSVDAFPRFDEKKISFLSNLGKNNKKSKIFIDDFALKRAIVNLLANADEATRKKAEIKVAITLKGDKLNILVSDTGKGMPEDIVRNFHSERMFSTKGSGHGFGLINLKETVTGHGGIVKVQSTLGKGTIFNIEIPTKATR